MVKELQKRITQDIDIVTQYSQIVESAKERGSGKCSEREVTYHVQWIFNKVKKQISHQRPGPEGIEMPDLSCIKEDCQPGKQYVEKLSFSEAQIRTFPDKQQSREFIPWRHGIYEM